jgi:hypothetical protein
VSRYDEPLKAKLGGSGLGLVALLSIEKIEPGFTSLSDLRALGRFVVFMQKDDGSFYSSFIPSRGGRYDKWQSLYYPGEAALGLLLLYEKDLSEVWLESAAKALAYLADSRKYSVQVPADHWALLATEKLLALRGVDQLPVPADLLINHGAQISQAILREQVVDNRYPEYAGGFSPDGRTTPTATRLEGLLAASRFLPAEFAVRRRIDVAVPRGISFLLRAQVGEGQFAGAFPRAVKKVHQAYPDADNFNLRVNEVRIDYVQHALSAMIQYLDLTDGSRLQITRSSDRQKQSPT